MLRTDQLMSLIHPGSVKVPRSKFGKKTQTKKVIQLKKRKTKSKKLISSLKKKLKSEEKKLRKIDSQLKTPKRKTKKKKSTKTRFGRLDNVHAGWCDGQECANPSKMGRYPYQGNWKPSSKYGTPPIMGGRQYGEFPNSVVSPYPYVRKSTKRRTRK
jgi:hypothetical protein